ncbi:MAG: class I SAM-dependent RNA methyltransferase, partial [Deltaproteobacteria bacterium]|nr:class I SAM-dependent RNA methyltransferase [Nannocystaceae bacterium]
MESPVQLVIRTLATGGDAVGHPSGDETPSTWFVADALPGERVLAESVRAARKHVIGRVLEVLEPSAQRVVPPCPLEGICGGCGWQHIEVRAQHELKRVIVRDALRGLGVEPVLGPNPGGDGLNYRRRARLHYRKQDGELVLGFHRRRSGEVIDVPRCPVLVPALAHAVARLRRVADVLPAEGEVLGLAEGKQAILGLPGVRPVP